MPGSFRLQSLKLAELVNRIYSQFLSARKNYVHDSVSHDFRDEGFTMSKLKQKDISLYGITDGWRASKIDKYLLRFAKYVEHGVQFTTTHDADTVDIGKTFYRFNKNSATGRILAIDAPNKKITLDKEITIAAGATYKGILRKDDGAPHAELTVDLALTPPGSRDIIYFTGSFSGITMASCPIYGIGISGQYYDVYRCAGKNAKDNGSEILGALYDAEVFRIYNGDTSDPAADADTPESVSKPQKIKNERAVPPNVLSLQVRENYKVIGSVDVHVTRPEGRTWAYCEIYIREEANEIDRFVATTHGVPVAIASLKLNKEYIVKAISYSANRIPNPTPFEAHITLKGTVPPRVTGLQIIHNRGNSADVFGQDFEVKCHDMTSDLSHEFVKQTNEWEGLRYLWQVYYSGTTAYGIPGTVKLGNIKVNDKEAYHIISRENKFRFTLADNIEAMKNMYENYATDPNYNTYYGNPRREVRILVMLINAWGKQSPAAAEAILVNPPPDMNNSAGNNTTPVVQSLKSALRVKFPHPYKEYDTSHFLVKYSKNANMSSPATIRVTSAININSSDEDVDATSYKVEIDNLDPKYTYYVQVTPCDVFGAGTPSLIASAVPGLTFDDTELDITPPQQVTGVTLALVTTAIKNNLRGSWTKNTEIDIKRYIYDYRGVQNTGATIPPTLAEIAQGYLNSDNTIKCYGQILGIDQQDAEGVGIQNWTIIQDAKQGYKYFLMVKAVNSSDLEGVYSTWATHTETIGGVSADDLPSKWAMYKFLGTVTAVDANHISWVGGTPGLKKKTESGSTNININNGSSTLFAGTRFLAYVGTATLSIKTEAEMDADSTFVAVTKIVEAPSGKCKVLMMLSAENFSIAAFEGGFNQVSAITADLGEITAGTITGATIQTAGSGSRVVMDSSGIRAYNGANQRVQISSDGSGWLGASNKLYWDTSGNLTVTGVIADSVAAEDITAGTITGSTLQTAATGKRFVVTVATNQAEFYGDRGDGTVEKLATIGIIQSGLDYFIADFGNAGASNTRMAIRAKAYGNSAILAYTGGGGHAILAQAGGAGYPIWLETNSTKAHLHLQGISAAPSSPFAGDIYYNTTTNILYCYNGSGWQALF